MRIDEQGLHLHQSDLKNNCLEKLRLDTIAEGPRMETDAATVGTILHATIEHELLHGEVDRERDLCAIGANFFLEQLEMYHAEQRGYVQSTFPTHQAALESLAILIQSWYRSEERAALLASTTPAKVEWSFDLPFAEVPVKRYGSKATTVPVYLAGTADIIWQNQIWDWKSASSEYRQWEKQRWDRQPDVYTWAAHQAGLIEPNEDGLFTFEFKVFVRRAQPVTPQTVTVLRSPNHWEWLYQIVARLVNMVHNLGLDREWPLNDQHVLCSPKWCSFFDSCKGASISGSSWT